MSAPEKVAAPRDESEGPGGSAPRKPGIVRNHGQKYRIFVVLIAEQDPHVEPGLLHDLAQQSIQPHPGDSVDDVGLFPDLQDRRKCRTLRIDRESQYQQGRDRQQG